MKSTDVRKTFMDFFKSKTHKIVASAPMVVKNDPTLMFTNAGMNQFKDIFLDNEAVKYHRIANTQKCLRVSGKHNDLEEVGHDTYHHTMFEMLGNWSFGDYFKKEAIAWAWELLTGVYGIDPKNLYVTVFGGDDGDGLGIDQEAYDYWKAIIPEDRILYGSKKDNFWEMGETGPCGPCSEIHVDIRSAEEKAKNSGKELVNMDHPQVIEVWNLVFIEFNRSSDAKLHPLSAKHVDTGMGFERLCMVLQGQQSNYDTDIFQPIIQKIASIAAVRYGGSEKADIAMRVIADHLRAITFAIADGQLPSNTGAGYVIRRILRRAVRYGFTFLDLKEPFIHQLVPTLVQEMGPYFPEIVKQETLIRKVIAEEEQSFLRTLSQGIKRFDQYMANHTENKKIDGDFAFELFDTYGFPIDLTGLIASEQGWEVDMEGFNKGLTAQKERSRKAAKVDTDDWITIIKDADKPLFIGYELLQAEVQITRFRKVKPKGKAYYELVFDRTPFYAESGGQVGDRGMLSCGGQKIPVIDTYKENELIIHRTPEIFEDPSLPVMAEVDGKKRLATENNHTATHLMHAALRTVLGEHVEQKGSLVDDQRFRFDFAHFSKMSDEEIKKVEQIVNDKIRENILLEVFNDVPIEEAKTMGAMALFGEKYGETVRVITFNKEYSVELCGGCHARATGQIGFFKILSEGAIAAGIRRIEAVTALGAEKVVYKNQDTIEGIREVMKNTKDLVKAVGSLADENKSLLKKVDELEKKLVSGMKDDMLNEGVQIGDVLFIAKRIEGDAKTAKDLAFSLKDKAPNLFLLLGTAGGGKANLTLMLSDAMVSEKKMHAGNIIRELAKNIRGGGGGQPHFASAGGSNPDGIDSAFAEARKMFE